MNESETILIRCFVTEPWESVYMLFMLPGVIVWIAGVIWCFRKRNIRGSVLLQVIGALEVVVGAGAAFVVGISETTYNIEASRAFDPMVLFEDIRYIWKVSLIGLVAHIVLLSLTLVFVFLVKRPSKTQTS